jgi:hypothetical protein
MGNRKRVLNSLVNSGADYAAFFEVFTFMRPVVRSAP